MFAVERSMVEDGGAVLYRVSGEIFFASVDLFTSAFDADAGRPVIIDVSAAHFWDISGLGALNIIISRLQRACSYGAVIGYNTASADAVDSFAIPAKPGVKSASDPHQVHRHFHRATILQS